MKVNHFIYTCIYCENFRNRMRICSVLHIFIEEEKEEEKVCARRVSLSLLLLSRALSLSVCVCARARGNPSLNDSSMA